MKRSLPIVVLLLAGLPLRAEAHRLDEYLQASRVAITADGIEVELDLTPGAAVAASIFPLIDRDADLSVTPPEIETYARRVLADLALQVDGRGYPLTLTRAECPSWPEIRDGMGTITIVATAETPWRPGSHHVRYENFHRRNISVFLANALVPADREISIVAQERDSGQQRFDLEISVAPASSRFWPALPLMVVAVLLVTRRR